MKSAKDYFNMGYGARRNNLTKTANPLLFAKGWPHEAWNMGFDFADLELNAPGQDEALLERVPARPYWQGWNKHMAGVAREDCPYAADSADSESWLRGWDDAKTDSLPLPSMAGCYEVAKGLAMLAIIAALLWALWHIPWPQANARQIECQEHVPPWQSVDCR